jgi:hypothetical protein
VVASQVLLLSEETLVHFGQQLAVEVRVVTLRDNVDQVLPVLRHGMHGLFVKFGVGLMAGLFLSKEGLEVGTHVIVLLIVLIVWLIIGLIVGLRIVLIVGLVVGLREVVCDVAVADAVDVGVRDLASPQMRVTEIIVAGV